MHIKLFEEISNDIEDVKIIKRINFILMEYLNVYDDSPSISKCGLNLSSIITTDDIDADDITNLDENGEVIVMKLYQFIVSDDDLDNVKDLIERYKLELHNKFKEIGLCCAVCHIEDSQFADYNEDAKIASFAFIPYKYVDKLKLEELDDMTRYEFSKKSSTEII